MRLFGCHLRSWHAGHWLISVWYGSWAERFNRWLGCCISYVTTIVKFGGGDHTDCRIFIWKLTLTSTYLDSHEYEENPLINSNYFMYTDCRIGCGLTLLKLWPLFGGRATQGGLKFSINARIRMGERDPVSNRGV